MIIDNMFSVMNRINEIKSRFNGNNSNIPDQTQTNQFKDMHDEMAAKTVSKNKSVDKSKFVNEVNGIVDHYSSIYKVPSGLVRSVIKAESNYNPDAVSPKGAKGLMQLMPSIIKDMNVDNPFNPSDNVKGGVKLLKELLDEYNGDYKKAIAAYNAGRGAVKKYDGVPDYKETKAYVKNVINSYLENK
jgi:soluble lytic murein transglycosylase-like protein